MLLRLTPESCIVVVGQVNIDAIAENVAEQFGEGVDLTAASYDKLKDAVEDGLVNALGDLTFEVE